MCAPVAHYLNVGPQEAEVAADIGDDFDNLLLLHDGPLGRVGLDALPAQRVLHLALRHEGNHVLEHCRTALEHLFERLFFDLGHRASVARHYDCRRTRAAREERHLAEVLAGVELRELEGRDGAADEDAHLAVEHDEHRLAALALRNDGLDLLDVDEGFLLNPARNHERHLRHCEVVEERRGFELNENLVLEHLLLHSRERLAVEERLHRPRQKFSLHLEPLELLLLVERRKAGRELELAASHHLREALVQLRPVLEQLRHLLLSQLERRARHLFRRPHRRRARRPRQQAHLAHKRPFPQVRNLDFSVARLDIHLHLARLDDVHRRVLVSLLDRRRARREDVLRGAVAHEHVEVAVRKVLQQRDVLRHFVELLRRHLRRQGNLLHTLGPVAMLRQAPHPLISNLRRWRLERHRNLAIRYLKLETVILHGMQVFQIVHAPRLLCILRPRTICKLLVANREVPLIPLEGLSRQTRGLGLSLQQKTRERIERHWRVLAGPLSYK
mmetsp:Transcript_26799/g.87932  ORF Transcript_26799/g.87932 Transcript_26799/m.87932 type:complete len:501 (+) Transcript_26799:89-1591(+)